MFNESFLKTFNQKENYRKIVCVMKLSNEKQRK